MVETSCVCLLSVNGIFLFPGCLKRVGVFGFLLFSLSLIFIPLFLHPAVPMAPAPPPPPPLLRSLPGLVGLRPCGLEDDVRQYEEDLAKRLYQARVRASQGTSEAPTSSASAAASQLRSASRPWQLGPDAMHHGGVLGCFGIEYSFASSSEGSKQALAAVSWQCFHHLCCLASAHPCCLQPPPPFLPSRPFLPLSAAVLSCTLVLILVFGLTHFANHL